MFRVERYSDLAAFSHGGEFNPHNPKVMELLSNWADQFLRLFPSSFVHIGFDDEYTEYRLASTLGRWDAEYEYWRRLQAQLRDFSRRLKDGDTLPPLETVAHGN